MPQQWANDQKPKGLTDQMVLVLGPDDYDDEEHVRWTLDQYTFKMEAVSLIAVSDGPKQKYLGVGDYAYRWADRHWWPRYGYLPEWWGFSPKQKKEHNTRALRGFYGAITETLARNGRENAHCIVFWDQEKAAYADLIDRAREVVPMRNFKIVKVV